MMCFAVHSENQSPDGAYQREMRLPGSSTAGSAIMIKPETRPFAATRSASFQAVPRSEPKGGYPFAAISI